MNQETIQTSTTPNEQPRKTKKPPSDALLIRERFYDSVANQANLMDSLAQSLITIQLAIPGLYATALKWVSKPESFSVTPFISAAVVAWLLALVFSVAAIFPRKYSVNREAVLGGGESMEDFFHQSARYKWKLLLGSIICFILAILAILGDVFYG